MATDCANYTGGTSSPEEGVIRASPVTPTTSYTVTHIQATLTSTTGVNIIFLIYSDNSNAPDSQLATTGSISAVEGTNDYELTVPLAVTASTKYWIALQQTDALTTVSGTQGQARANMYANATYGAYYPTYPSLTTPDGDTTGFHWCLTSGSDPGEGGLTMPPPYANIGLSGL